MTKVHQSWQSRVPGKIHGIANYYTDLDGMQHVIVATSDGSLHEMHWNHTGKVSAPTIFQRFDKLTSLAGLYAPDGNIHHIFATTGEGSLFDVFFNQSHPPQTRTLLTQLPVAGKNIGMAGFYSSNDKVCHAIVLSKEGKLYDVTFSKRQIPVVNEFPIQFDLQNIASLAGFFSPGDNLCHIIVAFIDGRIFDVSYNSQQQRFASVSHLRDAGEKILVVAGFFLRSRNAHQIVIYTKDHEIYEYSQSIHSRTQDTSEKILSTPSSLKEIVVDIVGYHSSSDSYPHILIATRNGNLYDFYYPL